MTTATARTSEQEARRRRTVAWVIGLAFVGLVFDGYDLVVYGAVLSTFLADPTQIGPVTPPLAARWAATPWSACWSGPCSPGPWPTSSAGARSCRWPMRGSRSAWP